MKSKDLVQENFEVITKFFSMWRTDGIIVYTPKGIGQTVEIIFRKRDRTSKARLHEIRSGYRLKDTVHQVQVWHTNHWGMGVKTKIGEGHLIIPPGLFATEE